MSRPLIRYDETGGSYLCLCRIPVVSKGASRMNITENFIHETIPKEFYWFHEPTWYRCGHGLEIWTDPETDFWQRTH